MQTLICIGTLTLVPTSFDCNLPINSCGQFAPCNNYSGKCDCPEGFGGDNCLEPRTNIPLSAVLPPRPKFCQGKQLTVRPLIIECGSLPRGHNRPTRQGKSCECDEGWTGINCNMCTSDRACDAMTETGDGGVCYTGGEVVKQNYQMCDVTNKAIRELLGTQVPQVTFTCDRNSGECDFQCAYWIPLLLCLSHFHFFPLLTTSNTH